MLMTRKLGGMRLTVAALAACQMYAYGRMGGNRITAPDLKMPPPPAGQVPRSTPKMSGRPPVGWRQVQGRARHAERMRRQRVNTRLAR